MSPSEIARRSAKTLEDLAVMCGMQGDKAHSAVNVTADHLCVFVSDLIMCFVSPPDKHIGIGQYFLGNTLVFIIKCGIAYGNIVMPGKKLSYTAVYSLGIYFSYRGLIFFMTVFIPYKYIYHCSAPPL